MLVTCFSSGDAACFTSTKPVPGRSALARRRGPTMPVTMMMKFETSVAAHDGAQGPAGWHGLRLQLGVHTIGLQIVLQQEMARVKPVTNSSPDQGSEPEQKAVGSAALNYEPKQKRQCGQGKGFQFLLGTTFQRLEIQKLVQSLGLLVCLR